MEQTHAKIAKWLPRLIPFFVTAGIYINHFERLDISGLERVKAAEAHQPSILSAVLKCLPIISLIGFVASHEEPAGATLDQKSQRYKASIAIGLALGCVGDACLVFPETFIVGMLAFAAGHMFYIYALGFKPLLPKLGLVLYILSFLAFLFLREGVKDEMIQGAMPFYSVFLVTMAWRAVAKSQESPSCWRKVGALGGILFILSDSLLVLQFDVHIPYGELMVISTYYLSQMCTALSILDSPVKQD